jgi:hypothetical protein
MREKEKKRDINLQDKKRVGRKETLAFLKNLRKNFKKKIHKEDKCRLGRK